MDVNEGCSLITITVMVCFRVEFMDEGDGAEDMHISPHIM